MKGRGNNEDEREEEENRFIALRPFVGFVFLQSVL